MSKLFQQFIGKNCKIATVQDTTLKGTVMALEDSWIVLKPSQNIETTKIINLEYVIHIDEIKKDNIMKRRPWHRAPVTACEG